LGDSHVAALTPGSSPRVSHDPVALVSIASVPNHTDGVIESRTASGVVEDTRMVTREGASVGFDQDRDGLLGDETLHGADVVSCSHVVGAGFDTSSSAVVSARSVLGGVGVRRLSHEVVLSGIVEGSSLPSTTATVVALVAVNELLLGERQKSASLDEVTSFKGGSGGEGPARTALSLVLDTVDGTLGSPVERSTGGSGRWRARTGRRSTTLITGELTVE